MTRRFVAGEVHTGFLDSEFKMRAGRSHADDERGRAARRRGPLAHPA